MITALAIAAVMQATVPSASAPSPVSGPPFGCVRDGSTPEINACLEQDLAAEDARMERYLTAARELARTSDEQPRSLGGPSAQRGFLAASQVVWTAYARVVCEGVDDRFKDGSIHTAMFLGCMIDMTLERTRVIWRTYLSHMDATPPVLPEPVVPVVTE